MKSILKRIIKEKIQEVARKKSAEPLEQLVSRAKKFSPRRKSFLQAITAGNRINCIGELKQASPSKGLIRKLPDIRRMARTYAEEGVCAISVLTDKNFHGNLADLMKVKQAVDVPVLRKDFIVDEYQVYEAFLSGADAILLIAAVLSGKQLRKLLLLTKKLKLDALVEIHSRTEIKKLDMRLVRIIGINNRNLQTFEVDLETTAKLAKFIPKKKVLVSESGINSRSQMLQLQDLGVSAALVGEGIVRAKNIRKQIRILLGARHDKN